MRPTPSSEARALPAFSEALGWDLFDFREHEPLDPIRRETIAHQP